MWCLGIRYNLLLPHVFLFNCHIGSVGLQYKSRFVMLWQYSNYPWGVRKCYNRKVYLSAVFGCLCGLWFLAVQS